MTEWEPNEYRRWSNCNRRCEGGHVYEAPCTPTGGFPDEEARDRYRRFHDADGFCTPECLFHGTTTAKVDGPNVEEWLRRTIRTEFRSFMNAATHRFEAYAVHGPSAALARALDGDMDGAGQAVFDDWVSGDLARWEPGRNLHGLDDLTMARPASVRTIADKFVTREDVFGPVEPRARDTILLHAAYQIMCDHTGCGAVFESQGGKDAAVRAALDFGWVVRQDGDGSLTAWCSGHADDAPLDR